MLTFIYRLYDKAGVLLYIGITTDPNRRFAAHAADKPWWPEVAHHIIEEIDTATARQTERETIRQERPRYNVSQAVSDTVARPSRRRIPTSIDDAPEFLDAAQVAGVLGCSSYALRDLERRDSAFPQPRPISPALKAKRWRRDELRGWLARQM